MSLDFASYTEISVNALKFNPKSHEVVDRKREIFQSIAEHRGQSPASVLFVGFSPFILTNSVAAPSLTCVTPGIKKYLDSHGIKYTHIDEKELPRHTKNFDWVVAGDEFFTFASTEEQQRTHIDLLSSLAKQLIVTTLKDYKNQDFRDREFSQPLAVRNGKQSKVFLEYHDMDYANKNSWDTTVYEMEGTQCQAHGPYARTSMFFKQLAKFSIDAGAREFYVHKNLMYKSLIKKNYEHVISILF